MTLLCKVVGSPMPVAKWFKDGERIYPFGKFEMKQQPDGTCELYVNQMSPMDAGCYRCVADNDFGTASTRCEVTVEGITVVTHTNVWGLIQPGHY